MNCVARWAIPSIPPNPSESDQATTITKMDEIPHPSLKMHVHLHSTRLIIVSSMKLSGKTIDYGGEQVSLISRSWKSLWGARNGNTPYYQIEIIKPGQSWLRMAADASGGYTEHYVEFKGKPLPVGIMIARELRDEGAVIAVCTDLTRGPRFINTDLICIEPEPPLSELLEKLRAANGNNLRGLPDAVAIFPDGPRSASGSEASKKRPPQR
jgi:hypothetical protein